VPPLQAVTAAQTHSDMSRVDAIAAQVRALDKQLRAADKEAAQFNSRWVELAVSKHPVVLFQTGRCAAWGNALC
jgi:hypothetical protein